MKQTNLTLTLILRLETLIFFKTCEKKIGYHNDVSGAQGTKVQVGYFMVPPVINLN
jgi:hypothetical protein